MIKKVILFPLVILISVLLFFSSNSYAVDISIGASGWYAWWDMDEKGRSDENNFDPTPLYGPVLSISFTPNWSLSTIFLYGKYKMEEGSDNSSDDIKRYDSDTALNYSFNRYVKIFGGLKYMGYEWDSGEHIAYGPALGLALTVPLFENFYLLCNVSGMYIFGKEEGEHDGVKEKTDYVETGINSNLSIAYYIAPVSTSVILGFRYQYFITKYDSDEARDVDHTFYGVTLSAVYSFSI